MTFTNKPTEQTTAITDAILAAMAIAAALYVNQIGYTQWWKASLWVWAFGLLAVAATLGAIAHGFKLSHAAQKLIWPPIFLALGLLVALLIVATVYDIWGQTAAQQILPVMIVLGIIFFGTTLIWPDTFAGFIIYEAVAMHFVLAGYIWLATANRLDGAWFMIAGILITIIAAGVQAGKTVTFTLIWQFDHNGAYHLVQMVGLIFLVIGLHLAFLSR